MSLFVSYSLYENETIKLINYARNMYPRAQLSGQGGMLSGHWFPPHVGLCIVLLTVDRRLPW